MTDISLIGFIQESNRIEGIVRPITDEQTRWEFEAHKKFLALKRITVGDLDRFVSVIQPGAKLRRNPGMDVRVGDHIPPPGGPDIISSLEHILSRLDKYGPYGTHIEYEALHPFTDGNGRSGRALWLWMIGGIEKAPLGFLHHWYYSSLDIGRGNP